MDLKVTDELIGIADRFQSNGKIKEIKEFGSGNINRTYLVTSDCPQQSHFILQKVNTQVFKRPELVMQNMCIVTEHIDANLREIEPRRIWKVPHVIRTSEGQDCWQDETAGCWRAIAFIEGAQTFDIIQDSHHAQEIGYALGMFHHLIQDLPPARLADTLPGFHITPGYLAQYKQVLCQTQASTSSDVLYGLKFVSDRISLCSVLEDAKDAGKLQLRLMHGDPKINNVLIDNDTKQAISAIDLDTVKPGLIHYDIGDCLRSGCNLLGEETEDLNGVHFEVDLCQDILQGYLSVAQKFLTIPDYDYIYLAIRLISFELGLRFFTDYLAGNVYFKVKHPEHNLARALVQFKLTESIEAQEAAIQTIVKDLR
jgi:hypothetical protein